MTTDTKPAPGRGKMFPVNTDDRIGAIIRNLSDRAKANIEKLELLDLAANGLAREKYAKSRELTATLTDLQQTHFQLKRQIERAGPIRSTSLKPGGIVEMTPAQDTSLAAYETQIEEAKAAIKRNERVKVRRSLMPLVRERFEDVKLRDTFPDAELPEVRLRKGQGPADFLAEARSEAKAIEAEIKRVQYAPRTVEEVRATIQHDIDRLAERGRPILATAFAGGSFDNDGRYRVANNSRVSFNRVDTGHSVSGHIHTIPDAFAVMAWLYKDDFIAKLEALAEEEGKPERAIAAKDKPALLQKLDNKFIHALRVEEEAIRLCEAAGVDAERRASVDPLIWLQVELTPVKRAIEPSEDEFAPDESL